MAAANPIFGRYDKSKSLKNNIQLSAPIMSRFDLFFVVCDESNPTADQNLSEFIDILEIKPDWLSFKERADSLRKAADFLS